MPYLRIMNDGECSELSFTMLGLSTARGDKEKIGDFGSGAKMGVLTLLRKGLTPIIYSGLTQIRFSTKTATMQYNGGETPFEQVFVKIGQRKLEKLNMSIDYGAMDWHTEEYAIREFISNALDSSHQDVSAITVDIVDKITPEKGRTIVGIPLNDKIKDYYNDLSKYFLHFNPNVSRHDNIIAKTQVGPARIYRKRVFVKQVDSKLPSLFDYNFGDELKINESRDLDCYSIECDVVPMLAKSDKIGEVFMSLVEGIQTFETSWQNWRLENVAKWDKKIQAIWQEQWKKRFGSAVLAIEQQGELINTARQQGHTVHIIRSMEWYKALCNSGIKTVIDVLHDVNDQGHRIFDPTPTTISTLNKVWAWLEAVNLVNEKTKPPVVCFEQVQHDESLILGYVKDKIVHINCDHDSNEQVMLEELSHYVTGASDNTLPFQSFAFQVATKAFKTFCKESQLC